MKRLDLGSTYMFDEPKEDDLLVETCLDGSFCYVEDSNYGDPIPSAIQMFSDYKQLPFADGTFDEVAGSCFLEEETINDQRRAYAEIHRILKLGGTLTVKGCGPALRRRYYDTAIAVGFQLIAKACIYTDPDEGWLYDVGYTFRRIM